MLYERYSTTILDMESNPWRISILQENNAPWAVSDVTLEGDTPISIEWSEVDKLEPVMSSSCTLQLNSDDDRQFLDLYTVGYGQVRLNLYKGDDLYWSGCIDPELYEEPYTSQNNYTVSLTFSDFGSLEYKQWSTLGILSMEQIIDECVALASLSPSLNMASAIRMISTKVPGSTSNILSDIQVSCLNFFDEDMEAMTCREVLDEVLRCLGLQLRQIAGRIAIYDVHALSQQATIALDWNSSDANLSFDKTFNNVQLTYSPYVEGKLADGQLDDDDVTMPLEEVKDGDLTIATTGQVPYYTEEENQLVGFMWGITQDDPTDADTLPVKRLMHTYWYKIDSVFSGSDEVGVSLRCGGKGVVSAAAKDLIDLNMANWSDIIGVMQLTSQPYIWSETIEYQVEVTDWAMECDFGEPTGVMYPVGTHMETRQKYPPYFIQLKLDILIDDRVNPFESDDMYRNNTSYNHRINGDANFVYIPIKLELLDEDGNVMYHYQNSEILASKWQPSGSLDEDITPRRGKWVAGDAAWGNAWLAYYDSSDTENKPGMRGWKTNKPMRYRKDDPNCDPLASEIGDGQLVPMPPCPGYLRYTIGSGSLKLDKKDGVPLMTCDEFDLLAIKWQMYRNPKLTLLDANGQDIDAEDIEHSAWINPAAKEDVSIDTIVGSSPDDETTHPSAKGQFRSSQLTGVSKLSKAGVEDTAERLLIGAVYSQYAGRKLKLSGTVSTEQADSLVYHDNADDASRKYMLLSDVQRIRECEREVVAVEIVPENYTAVNWR